MARSSWRAALAALPLLLFGATPAIGEEGMWTFDRFPVERMRATFDWAPDQAWLDRAMAGTARVPGCSASSVSARGLVLTNHHCVIACVTALSSAQENFIEAGFVAYARQEERRCPNLSVQVLTDVSDVTERIDAAASGVGADAFASARNAEIARIEAECTQGARRCEVVTLYQGGRYALYVYRRFDDVRLVFAPEHAMAAFGGEADNFNFPRYCIDFAFLRLYERGEPARTPNHLSLRFTPLEEGEVVLVAGNPGRTSRLRTTAELTFERDVNLPWQIASLGDLRGRLIAYAERGAEERRLASNGLQTIDNALKGLSGRRLALEAPQNLARVQEREQDLQTRVRRNRANQTEVGDAWGEIARAQTAYPLPVSGSARGRAFAFVWLGARYPARDQRTRAAQRRSSTALRRYALASCPAIAERKSPDHARAGGAVSGILA